MQRAAMHHAIRMFVVLAWELALVVPEPGHVGRHHVRSRIRELIRRFRRFRRFRRAAVSAGSDDRRTARYYAAGSLDELATACRRPVSCMRHPRNEKFSSYESRKSICTILVP